jgi:HAE1 family hydrophobic/amphiphilic exporter-1/multidrug efflux pump
VRLLFGTFGALAVFGYTINTLTLFALVLSIACWSMSDRVIENVERIMREEQMSPRDATRKSMQQITGALIAIALVLSAVFVPMAFLRRIHADLSPFLGHDRIGDGASISSSRWC